MINEDDAHALAALRRDQGVLQTRLQDLEEQRRLHERLSYSRYYLDMQLHAVRGELSLCQYRLRHLERSISQAAKARPSRRSVEGHLRAEEAGRHFGPAMGAFVVSILALVAAGLLYSQRVAPPPLTPLPTSAASVLMLPTSTPSPTPTPVATAVVITTVFAVNQTDGLNVRRGAGTGEPVLRILKRGDIVELAGDQEDSGGRLWYHLKDAGWLAAEHLQIYPSRAEAEAAAAALPN
ncbi:MAG: SH3 domain-containing protein [Chloroflexota bacterium]